MANFIFIANQACRTGGNLLNRLFDGNKKCYLSNRNRFQIK